MEKNMIIKETKLKRLYYNYDYLGYHWSISSITYPELEVLVVDDESSRGYKTPEEAYKLGIKHLKKHKHGDYMLEISYWPGGGNKGEYDTGYCAVIHNGKVVEY